MTRKKISIILISALIGIALPLGGFYLGFQYRESQIPKETKQNTAQAAPVEENLEVENVKSKLPEGYKIYSEEELNDVAQKAITYHLENNDEQELQQDFVIPD